jgi:hypothetical protein
MGGLNRARYVRHQGNSRSPVGREPHGDGAPIVVRGRESRPHGEGGQVVGWSGRGGTRHARRRDDPGHHPRKGQELPHGHPCRETDTDPSDPGPGRLDINHWRAVCGKSRMHGSEGGRWKRAELIGTSPAAYPTRETRIGLPGGCRVGARRVSIMGRLLSLAGGHCLGDVRSEARIVCPRGRDTQSVRCPTLANPMTVFCRGPFPREFRGMSPEGHGRALGSGCTNLGGRRTQLCGPREGIVETMAHFG